MRQRRFLSSLHSKLVNQSITLIFSIPGLQVFSSRLCNNSMPKLTLKNEALVRKFRVLSLWAALISSEVIVLRALDGLATDPTVINASLNTCQS